MKLIFKADRAIIWFQVFCALSFKGLLSFKTKGDPPPSKKNPNPIYTEFPRRLRAVIDLVHKSVYGERTYQGHIDLHNPSCIQSHDKGATFFFFCCATHPLTKYTDSVSIIQIFHFICFVGGRFYQ